MVLSDGHRQNAIFWQPSQRVPTESRADGLAPVFGLDGGTLPAGLLALLACPTPGGSFRRFLGHPSGALRLYRPTADRVANRRYVLTSARDRAAR
jgi:hypothetical protein